MKLTILFTMFAVLQVNASALAQKITLSEKGSSLEKVLKDIRKQSGYDIFFNSNSIRKANPVTIKVEDASIQETLQKAFIGQPFTYTIELKTIVVKEIPNGSHLSNEGNQSQDKIITGRVTNELGEPMAGVSVRSKHSKVNTITTVNGTYRLAIQEYPEEIVFSYLGYQSHTLKITAITTRNFDVKLVPSSSEISDVVVTGIFNKSKESFTGASTTVTREQLANFGTRDLITSLRNIDPSFNIIESNAFGSNPNRLPEIEIRGSSGIPNVDEIGIGSAQDEARARLNTPLIILDGFQSTLQALLDMNENDVETITLLKDAAATSLYGSRGSNGVVVITTRLPVSGKLRLRFGTNLNFEAPDLSDYSLLKAREKLELERIAGYYNNARAESDLPLKRYYNFLLDEVNRGVETDWMAIPLHSAIGQRHDLSLEGGDQSFRYLASARYNDIQGVMKGSSRKTFNGKVQLSYAYRNIRFTNAIVVTQGNSTESPYGLFSSYSRLNPYWRAYDDNGDVLKLLGNPGNTDYSGRFTSLPTSPLYNATLRTFDKSNSSDLENQTKIDWAIKPSLNLRAQFAIAKSNGQSDVYRPADHTAFANYSVDDVFRKGDYKYGVTNKFRYDGSLNLNYSSRIGENHLLTAGFDFNVRQNENTNYNFSAEGFPNEKFDFISMALGYTQDGKPSGSEGLDRALGFTTSANYIYADRYAIDGSFRVDGSSQFGSKKRYAPFWSTGLGWNIHNEEFLADNKVINRLKIRGSMGITGSQSFSSYQALSTYRYYTDDRYYNWTGAYLMGLGNENLKWQQAMKYNIGTDIELFNSRLNITGNYYIETTEDLVSSVNLPASNGFPNYIENIGRMRNKGFELNATVFILSDPQKLVWTVTPSIYQNKNEVLETSQALKDAQVAIQNGASIPGVMYVEGYSNKTIWVVPSIGIDPSTGKELFLGADGNPTYTWSGSNVRAMGSTEPTVYGNFSTMVRYRDFSVNAAFRYTLGSQQYNQTLVNRVETGDYRYNVDSRVYDSRWIYPGDIAAFKGLLVTTPTNKTSRFVQDENTLSLSNINMQYNLRSKGLQKSTGLENLLFTLNISEPLYLSTIKRERGTDYPFSRQFSLSIRATF